MKFTTKARRTWSSIAATKELQPRITRISRILMAAKGTRKLGREKAQKAQKKRGRWRNILTG